MNLIRQPFGLLLLLSLAGFASALRAQDYVLDKGDLIHVAFWQEPSLNTQGRIDAEGKIDLPLVGRLVAGGKTVEQLSSSIVEKISVYNKKITQATVTVVEYGSRSIYLSGAVARPGRYAFQELPNVWKAILEAGGPAPNAQLAQVQIFRGGETSNKIETVDVTSAFESGNVKDLPRLNPGDYLNVPSITPAAGPGGGEASMSPTAIAGNPRNAIYVFGMVARPGVYPFEKDLDVLQAIVRAGGPAMVQTSSNNRAPIEPDLRRVRLISLGAEAPVVYVINIKEYTKQAAPLPLRLRPGDTIYIPGRANYGSFIFANTLVQVLTGTVSILTSYFVLNTLLGQN